MKKTITSTLALLAGAFVAHGQGLVTFANYGASTYLYVSYKPAVGSAVPLGGANTGPTPTASNYGTAGVIANGNDWSVALYGAVGANLTSVSLGPIYTSAAATTPVQTVFATGAAGADPDQTAGTWDSEINGYFPSAPNGTTATIALVAWYSGTGDTFAQASTAGLPVGESSLVNVVLGAPPSFPASLPTAALGNFNVAVTASVPEPSTIALGVLGASTFLMRLRRKQ